LSLSQSGQSGPFRPGCIFLPPASRPPTNSSFKLHQQFGIRSLFGRRFAYTLSRGSLSVSPRAWRKAMHSPVIVSRVNQSRKQPRLPLLLSPRMPTRCQPVANLSSVRWGPIRVSDPPLHLYHQLFANVYFVKVPKFSFKQPPRQVTVPFDMPRLLPGFERLGL